MNTALINQIHYFRIPVRDLDASVKWYTELLSFQLLAITDQNLAILKVGEGPLLVLVPTSDDTYGHFTINGEPVFSIGFTSPDIKKLHQHLIDNGVKADELKEDNGHLFFEFFDPNGNKLQAHW